MTGGASSQLSRQDAAGHQRLLMAETASSAVFQAAVIRYGEG